MDGQPFPTIPPPPAPAPAPAPASAPAPATATAPAPHHQTQVTHFRFHDSVNSNGNFEQLKSLINGGNAGQPSTNFNPDYAGSEVMFNEQTTAGDMFGFHSASQSDSNPGSINSSLTSFGGDVELEEEDEDDSSVSAIPIKKRTVNRARMLISEPRKRRNRMKDKLLALRALVPNVSKMDKASMVGDAVLYVQNLHMQIKKLRGEVAGLEFSLGVEGRETGEVPGGRDRLEELDSPKPRKVQIVDKKHPGCRKISQMEVLQVGESEFYVRLACNRGDGMAVALYRALESLTCFDVQSSNVTAVSDRFVLTFTLNVRKAGEEKNVSTLKKLVMGALLSQGFELKTLGDP